MKKLKAKLWVGKDYANFIVKDFAVDSPFTGEYPLPAAVSANRSHRILPGCDVVPVLYENC